MKESEKTFIEETKKAQTRKTLLAFDKKFKFYLLLSIVYGIFFINYIDVLSGGYEGYHLWLVIMYFFPFAGMSIFFRRNWQLTIGLGLIVSLMNDVFYGVVKNLMGFPLDLTSYYYRWLIPGNATLFQLNLGFTVIPVLSWMMALSIYARIIAVFFLLRMWKAQIKIRFISALHHHLKHNLFKKDSLDIDQEVAA